MNKSERQPEDKRGAFGLVAFCPAKIFEVRGVFLVALFLAFTPVAVATDGIPPGPDHYESDLFTKHTQYQLTGEDRRWAAAMKTKLKETGKTVYFVRTDIPLNRNETEIKGQVYKGADKPEVFYIPDCNVAIDLRMGTVCEVPGVRGEIRFPKSRNVIAFFDYSFDEDDWGWPGNYSVDHSPAEAGHLSWRGDATHGKFGNGGR